jgi:hypothetical protein
MKKLFIFLLPVLLLPHFIAAQTSSKGTAGPTLRVYYFHAEERCPIDQSVEENTKKVMQTNYQDKIKNGTIDFRIVNADDKANAKLTSGFDINAQALYIVKIEKGKEIKTDFTRFAFDWGLSNPMKFKKGLKDEIDKNLK